MTKAEYMEFHKSCCQKMMDITAKKNSDYTGDAASPFANFEQIGSLVQTPNVVEIGFLTRMSDKMSRIGSFLTKGSLLVKDESVEDTLIDLANYCLLFAGYLRSLRNRPKPGADYPDASCVNNATQSKPWQCSICRYYNSITESVCWQCDEQRKKHDFCPRI